MDQLTESLKVLIFILYFCFVIGVIVYALMLLNRFASAHERVADALEKIARKLGDGWKT